MLCKKAILKNLEDFGGKNLCRSVFLKKVAGLRMQQPGCIFITRICIAFYPSFPVPMVSLQIIGYRIKRVLTVCLSLIKQPLPGWGFCSIFFIQPSFCHLQTLLVCRKYSLRISTFIYEFLVKM